MSVRCLSAPKGKEEGVLEMDLFDLKDNGVGSCNVTKGRKV